MRKYLSEIPQNVGKCPKKKKKQVGTIMKVEEDEFTAKFECNTPMVGHKNFILLKKINTLIWGLCSILLFQSFPATVSMLRTELKAGRYPLPSSSGSSIPLYLHMTVGYDQTPRQQGPKQLPHESSRVENL
jgi:hypothetical protein